MSDALGPLTVGVISNRLISVLNEQQTALINTAFSSVVRESFDLACAVFDSRGEMIGQSDGGTPGHINAMATGMHHIVDRFPPHTLTPGDVLLTNDPWKTAGQINDITVATPVFNADRLVAWFATCCHAPDIGGRVVSAQANEVFEEGLALPIMKLFRAGAVNDDLIAIIRENVRTPDETVGDLYAQASANDVGAQSLLRLMDEFDLDTIDIVADEIMRRSEEALRAAIRALPDGIYRARVFADGFDDQDLLLELAATIDDDHITLDYTGSSPQSAYGVNVVLNYTRAYSSFAVKAAISPDVPHNAGSFRPVEVIAPPGSVLNCQRPAPVASRHLVGHYLPSLIFQALRQALPGKLMAESSDAVWMTIWRGHWSDGRPFMFNNFQAGGTGARAVKDGLSATSFPSGLKVVPTEVIETLTPLVQTRRALRSDSGGAGEFRGGLGQITTYACRSGRSWIINGNVDRVRFAARGAEGGGPGQIGYFGTPHGADLPRKRPHVLGEDDAVEVHLPGGGGYGAPYRRNAQKVLADVAGGYVSIDAALRDYGVAVKYTGPDDALVRPPDYFHLDEVATAAARSDIQSQQQNEVHP
jgi:N-methylhydantoinase B